MEERGRQRTTGLEDDLLFDLEYDQTDRRRSASGRDVTVISAITILPSLLPSGLLGGRCEGGGGEGGGDGPGPGPQAGQELQAQTGGVVRQSSRTLQTQVGNRLEKRPTLSFWT